MKPMMNKETEDKMGIDAIISRVESYVEDPDLVTPETLMELKEELMDLKGYMDGEDEMEEPEKEEGGLSIIIGKKMRGEK